MIKLFKTNIPLVFAFSVLFVSVAATTVFMDDTYGINSFFSWYVSILENIHQNEVLNYLLSVTLVITVGYFLNKAFNKTSFFQKSTGFPIFVYVTFLSTFNGVYFETALLIDLCFALAFLKLIDLDQNKSAINVAFVAGFLIGMAFLFSYWILPLGFLIFFSLSTFRPFQWREWLVAIIGMGLPAIYLLSIKYLLFDKYTFKPIDLTQNTTANNWADYIAFMILICIVILSVLKLLNQFKHILNVERKQINILAFFTVLTFFVSAGIFWFYKIKFFVFVVPLTLLVCIPVLNSRHSRLINLLFSALIVLNLLRIFVFR
ncbi:MAG: DUF6427 family protein [Putridiphycobacter sp.]|nr:DUF6427 family protein [Putridiphycobacter sp.]